MLNKERYITDAKIDESMCSGMKPPWRPVLQSFLDAATPFEDARYVVIGAPMDSTSSYRRGSRFAPDAIRLASRFMETYSPRTGLDLRDIRLADVGNVECGVDVGGSLLNIEDAIGLVHSSGKKPILFGGEHTVTLGALRALKPDIVVDLDAHLDLRDELLGLRLSHATFMRRALEELDFRLAILGCRALSGEEVEFARDNPDRVRIVSSLDLQREGLISGLGFVMEWLESASSAYLSIDLDVLDPSSAPAVGNPSPEGIGVGQLMDIVSGVLDKRFLGLDLTEVTPHYDSGLTATLAAYLALEIAYCMEARSQNPQP